MNPYCLANVAEEQLKEVDKKKADKNLEFFSMYDFRIFCKGNQINYAYYLHDKKIKTLAYEKCKSLISIPRTTFSKGNLPPKQGQYEALIVTGPVSSDKRLLGEMLYSLKAQFPITKDQEVTLVSYEEHELTKMNLEYFVEKVKTHLQDNMSYEDWVIIVVPHTIDHLKFIDEIQTNVSVKAVASKILLRSLYDDRHNTVVNFQHHMIPGYCQFAFLDSEGTKPNDFNTQVSVLSDTFTETRFIKTHQNRAIYSSLSDFIRCDNFSSERSVLLRSVYNRNIPSGQIDIQQVLFIPYRLPVQRQKWEQFKERILKQDGVLSYDISNDQKRLEKEKEEEHKKRYIKPSEYEYKLNDEIAEETDKLLALMKPLLNMDTRRFSCVFNIKGNVRFTDELENGVFKFQISNCCSFEEKLSNVKTSVEKIQVEENLELYKPVYENFGIEQLGFYISGKFLETKELVNWFNKNLLPPID